MPAKPASRPKPILPNNKKARSEAPAFYVSPSDRRRRRRVEELDTVDTERTDCRLPLRSR